MSRSRYRPPISHSWVRRLHRHERRERVDAIAADYDARVAAMHGLEWWERQWEARMRGGYRKRDRRVVRAARMRSKYWSNGRVGFWFLDTKTFTVKVGRYVNGRFVEDMHPGVPCHVGCGCV